MAIDRRLKSKLRTMKQLKVLALLRESNPRVSGKAGVVHIVAHPVPRSDVPSRPPTSAPEWTKQTRQNDPSEQPVTVKAHSVCRASNPWGWEVDLERFHFAVLTAFASAERYTCIRLVFGVQATDSPLVRAASCMPVSSISIPMPITSGPCPRLLYAMGKRWMKRCDRAAGRLRKSRGLPARAGHVIDYKDRSCAAGPPRSPSGA